MDDWPSSLAIAYSFGIRIPPPSGRHARQHSSPARFEEQRPVLDASLDSPFPAKQFKHRPGWPAGPQASNGCVTAASFAVVRVRRGVKSSRNYMRNLLRRVHRRRRVSTSGSNGSQTHQQSEYIVVPCEETLPTASRPNSDVGAGGVSSRGPTPPPSPRSNARCVLSLADAWDRVVVYGLIREADPWDDRPHRPRLAAGAPVGRAAEKSVQTPVLFPPPQELAGDQPAPSVPESQYCGCFCNAAEDFQCEPSIAMPFGGAAGPLVRSGAPSLFLALSAYLRPTAGAYRSNISWADRRVGMAKSFVLFAGAGKGAERGYDFCGVGEQGGAMVVTGLSIDSSSIWLATNVEVLIESLTLWNWRRREGVEFRGRLSTTDLAAPIDFYLRIGPGRVQARVEAVRVLPTGVGDGSAMMKQAATHASRPWLLFWPPFGAWAEEQATVPHGLLTTVQRTRPQSALD
ncbi:hypothetical protein BIW11_03452 [Tropilaelaps mercedesae]|uniref:Uncharacterized protein n=1 Tax=Tropilaelaps mercedesae TaxID=418985 RepID=A0A1V9XL18_9ACAR|nr:hypothetical protein BIW11_03452 [Tropilaelaps mercedesae]